MHKAIFVFTCLTSYISKRNGKNKFLFTGEHSLESIEALHRQLVAVVGIYSTKFGCKHVPGLSNLEA